MNEDREDPVRRNDEDDVARLLRLAGKRDSVPAERAARVKAAARDAWRGELVGRARRRRARLAAGLGAAAVLLLAIGWLLLPRTAPVPAPAAAIAVEALEGSAWSGPRALGVGERVRPGSEVSTSADGRLSFRLPSGHAVRLDASTKLRVFGEDLLALEAGAIYVETAFDHTDGTPVRVRTPLGTIEEIGTQFEVRLAGETLQVRLREGAVIMHGGAGQHEVRAGSELTVNPDGSATRRTIATHGAQWDWLAAVTPMPDLEGRSARAFLDWVARERGWTLAFADEAVARSAGETVLGGSAENLMLADALDAVLPTCRLSYRVDNGVLVVAFSAGSGPAA